MDQNTHENFARETEVKLGSERSFGLLMAVVFGLLAAYSAWHSGRMWPWLGIIAAAFALAAAVRPTVLAPINRLWHRFGLLLHSIVNPVIMGLIFYGAVLPTGLVMRAMGKDPLRLKRDSGVDSYWIVRQPPGPKPETMRDQF